MEAEKRSDPTSRPPIIWSETNWDSEGSIRKQFFHIAFCYTNKNQCDRGLVIVLFKTISAMVKDARNIPKIIIRRPTHLAAGEHTVGCVGILNRVICAIDIDCSPTQPPVFSPGAKWAGRRAVRFDFHYSYRTIVAGEESSSTITANRWIRRRWILRSIDQM
jgi:hypothetical protein